MGGGDSDIILDMCTKCDKDNKVTYVFFNTGMEYQATKNHLDFLEQKYGIEIIRQKPVKSIPTCCKEFGQPFISKQVSSYISRLQNVGFEFKDETFETLVKRYCKVDDIQLPYRNVEINGVYYKGFTAELKWWCNEGYHSGFTIANNSWLKEFLIQNPPNFKISSKCCDYAKKKVAKRINKELGADLSIIGVRKAEGGVRATSYKNCFDERQYEADQLRPVFWYNNSDKKDYENSFNIVHSDLYEKYGFVRTGCGLCPYGYLSGLEYEKEVVKKYEPNLYKGCNTIFKDSYEYTEKYLQFKNDMNGKYINYKKYLELKEKGHI